MSPSSFIAARPPQTFAHHARLAAVSVAVLLGSSQWIAAQPPNPTALDDFSDSTHEDFQRMEDYGLEGVMDQLGTPRGQELLAIVDPFEYVANVAVPPTGATAFMIELEYDLGSGMVLKYTTDVSVVQVPEPASCVLLLSGMAVGLLGVFRSRRGREGKA